MIKFALMRRWLWAIGFMGLSFCALAQAPTVQSADIEFSETYCNRTTISWTSGNGNGRIVIAREGQPIDTAPVSGYYIARDTFGDVNSKIGSDRYVVYNGSGNSTIVYGLKHNTVYYFAVYEYNGSGSNFSYNVTNYPEDSVLTEWLIADFNINAPHQCDVDNYFEFYENVSQSLNQTVNYSWTFGDGNSDNVSDPNHVYSAYGIYTVKLTATTLGCRASVTKKDTVAPIPIVDFVLTADTPNNTQIQCFYNADGSTNRFYFKNTTDNPSLGTLEDQANITWKWGDGTTSNSYNGRKIYTKPGVYRVTLIVSTSKTTNHSVYCTDSVWTEVTVKPRPLVADSIFFNDTVLCEEGHVFEFENNSGVPGNPTWYFGDGNTSTDNITSHSYSNPGKYNVILTFIDTSGCYDEYSDSVRVIPKPNNYFIGLDSPYCQFDPVDQLQVNLPGGYFFGDNVSSSGRFDPVMVGINTVSYVIESGICKDTSTQVTEVLPRPVFNLGNDTSICNGTSIELSLVKGNNSVLWSTGASDSFINVVDEDLYWAELDNGDCRFRDSIDIQVIHAPEITLGSDSTICGGSYRQVNISSDEATYVWSDGYDQPQRTFTETGEYYVLVYNKCGRDSASVKLTILPYPCEIFVPNAFSPNADNLNDTFRPIGNVQITGMVIYNRWGELLYQESGDRPAWDGTYLGQTVPQGKYMFIIYYNAPEGEFTKPEIISGFLVVVY